MQFISQSAPASEAPDEGGIWSPDETERSLAAELEKVLMHKPVIRPITVQAPATPSGDGDNDDAGFEWQQASEAGVESDPIEFSGPAASLKWVASARSDRRRRMMRNAAGWAVSVIVGTAIVGGAAFALTGWKPDLTGFVALVQHART